MLDNVKQFPIPAENVVSEVSQSLGILSDVYRNARPEPGFLRKKVPNRLENKAIFIQTTIPFQKRIFGEFQIA